MRWSESTLTNVLTGLPPGTTDVRPIAVGAPALIQLQLADVVGADVPVETGDVTGGHLEPADAGCSQQLLHAAGQLARRLLEAVHHAQQVVGQLTAALALRRRGCKQVGNNTDHRHCHHNG